MITPTLLFIARVRSKDEGKRHYSCAISCLFPIAHCALHHASTLLGVQSPMWLATRCVRIPYMHYSIVCVRIHFDSMWESATLCAMKTMEDSYRSSFGVHLLPSFQHCSLSVNWGPCTAGNQSALARYHSLHSLLFLSGTDNIFSIKSWCKQRFSFEESTLDKQFGIPEDLDYVD